jgi:threonine aldolase
MHLRDADFRSDTVTQPTPEMRDAMFAAPLGDDVFADDPTVNALQEFAANLLGFEAAIFAPSGTMTNLMALMSHCQRGDEVLCGQMWHTYRWEAGGMAVLGSIQPQPLPNQADGTIALSDLQAAVKPDDPHFARTRLVVMENTTGGKPLPLNYLTQVRQFAHTHELGLHLDGARAFNAAVAYAQATGTDPYDEAKALCTQFDSVSICLSKGLGAPVGSLLLGSAGLVKKARRIRKMLGGGMRQAGVIAAAGLYALQHNVKRLQDDHNNMQALAAGLKQAAESNPTLRGQFTVHAPNTNILFTDVQAVVADAFLQHLSKNGIRVTAGLYGSAAKRIRWVTHLDVGAQDITRAADVVKGFAA